MQRYIINQEELNSNTLQGEKFHHIVNVMRSKIKEQIELSCQNVTYLVQIKEILKDSLSFEIIDQFYFETEFPFYVSLLQGYPKGDKMDDIIKHSTELGVYNIIPALMERSIVKIDDAKRKIKQERLQKIAKEASMQSKRNHVPIIESIMELNKIDLSNYNVKILAYEEEVKKENNNLKKIIEGIKKGDKVILAVGPEGGFSPKEALMLINNGFISCSLGKRILRTETAGLFMLSAIGYAHENC